MNSNADTCFSDNGTYRSFANRLTTVPGNRHNPAVFIADPQFVRALAMAIESETQFAQSPRHLAGAQLPQPGQPATPTGMETVILASDSHSISLSPMLSPRSAR